MVFVLQVLPYHLPGHSESSERGDGALAVLLEDGL